MARFPPIFVPVLLAGAMAAALSARATGELSGGRHPREVAADDALPDEAQRLALPGETPVRGDTAVLSLLSDIDGFNPFTSSSREASEIQDLLFPRLMKEEADYFAGPPSFTPNLAERWEAGADGRSIRFTLRDCTWSDGTPISGADVRFSWEAARHKDVAWNSASIVDYIEDVEVHGPREITVRYSEAYPYQLMDINDVHILPRHVFGRIPFERWQQHGVWTDQARVSGGPWILERYVSNQEISFLPNPRWWVPGQPYLDRLVFRVQGTMETNLTALLSGDVDTMESILPKDARRVLSDGDVLVYSYMTRTIGWIGWNCRRAPFDDARVRRAMTHAIDRENIVESILYGYGRIAGPVIIHSMWASDHEIEPLPYDLSASERLLQEAGWVVGPDGVRQRAGKRLSFVLVTNAGNDVRRKICERAQADLREVGVEVEIRLLDFNLMSQQLKRHNFDAYVGGMSVATKVDGKPIFHSSGAEGRFNYPDYRNARVDEIIDTARVMADMKLAKPLWSEMQRIMDADQPYSTLYEPRGLVGVAKRFRGVRVTSLRAWDNVDEWWVPLAEQKYAK
jgi:peptide/nickel transport system substrate-binding protein